MTKHSSISAAAGGGAGISCSPSAAPANASELNQTDKSADAQGLAANGLRFLFSYGRRRGKIRVTFTCRQIAGEKSRDILEALERRGFGFRPLEIWGSG